MPQLVSGDSPKWASLQHDGSSRNFFTAKTVHRSLVWAAAILAINSTRINSLSYFVAMLKWMSIFDAVCFQAF